MSAQRPDSVPPAALLRVRLTLQLRLTAILESYQRNRTLGWVERLQRDMLNTVNDERERRDLDALTLGELERIERLALGHVDYADKFTWYLAKVATHPEHLP